MSNEKRLFLFLIITLVILFSFQGIFSQKKTSGPSGEEEVKRADEEPITEQRSEPNSPPTAKALSNKELYVSDTLANRKTKSFELGNYILDIAPRGGFIESVKLKEYKEEALVYRNLFLLPQYVDKHFEITSSASGIRMVYEDGKDKTSVDIKLSNPYVWQVDIDSTSPIKGLNLFSMGADQSTRFATRYEEIFYEEKGKDNINRLSWSGVKQEEFYSPLSLFGARDKHFTTTLFSPPEGQYILKRKEDDGSEEVTFSWSAEDNRKSYRCEVFIGPQKREILKQNGLEKIIDYGFFHFFAEIIIRILFFFMSILHNWGLSIIALSVLIYLILFPLTAKSTKSMRKMQEQMKQIQPKMNDIRTKYKDNQQKMNKEMMELYRKNNVNPLGSLGGCLPMFLQIPIFVALYQVLNRMVEIKGADFLWINDLSKPDYLFTLPFDIPFLGNGIHLLPLIMVGIMVLQQKFATPQVQSSEQQKMMSVILPLIFGVVFYRFPSGLVLYWLCNSSFTFLYQFRLTRAKSS